MTSDGGRGGCGPSRVDVPGVCGYVDHRDVFHSEEGRRHGDGTWLWVARVVKGGIVVDTAHRPD